MNPSISASPNRRPIQRLPEEVINQIAAGEVIERPSSILKELVENSLDSGATRIEVYLKNGGIDEVCVVDDGMGIDLEELPLAVERHATSKLSRAEDLFSLNTLGFRGEALSSICSVADVEIQSRTLNASSAYSVFFRMGRPVASPRFLGGPLGTRVAVSHLFENTPARKKFLRTLQTELTHCQNTLKEIALGHPEVRFSLHHNQKLLVNYTSQSKRDRFLECLKLKTPILAIENSHDHMNLQAFFASSETQVARAELYLFINGRPVRNRNFLSAIRNVYREMNPHIQEPVGACFLDIRKDWIDVNVHPQKWEVRCLEQAAIYHWLLSTLKKSLAVSRPSASSFSVASPEPLPVTRFPHLPTRPLRDFRADPSSLQWIGRTPQALICASPTGIIVADLKFLSSQFTTHQLLEKGIPGKGLSERLSLPCIIRLSQDQMTLFESHHGTFQKGGFSLEPFGEGDFSLQTRPRFVSDLNAEALFKAFLLKLADPLFAQRVSSDLFELIFFLASTAYKMNPEFQDFSQFELTGELERCRKERNRSFYVEIPYDQLQNGEGK